MTVLASDLALPVLEQSRTLRPAHARGPRSIEALRLLRISVTDRCNLRCSYCMPSEGVQFLPPEALLAPHQIEAVARVAHSLGVTHAKITGGEPTVRRDLLEILERIDSIGFEDVSLTTNGLQLERLASALRDAGVDRLTLSMDSLKPERYREITGGGRFDLVRAGIDAACSAGFERLKINVVVMPGVNDDEIGDFAELAIRNPWTIRFIEYMPLGESRITLGNHGESSGIHLDNEEVLRRAEERVGQLRPIDPDTEQGVGPATVFTAEGIAGRVGFISAMSRPFCEQCNRLRLTARGELRACLFDGGEVDVRSMLEPEVDVAGLRMAFQECIALKPLTHSTRGNRQMSELGG